MDYRSSRYDCAGLVGPHERNLLSDDPSGRFDFYLFIETIVVSVAAVGAVKVLDARSVLEFDYHAGPIVLIVATLFPAWLKRRKFSPFGLNFRGFKATLLTLGGTLIASLPLMVIGLWVLRALKYESFVPSGFSIGRGWINWLLYQFLCVALLEEVFFRGYVQGNILGLIKPADDYWLRQQERVSIVLSAGCFALAHVVIQGRLASGLTFLPGLALGWLFIRTKTLLAPILFHGAANVCYLLMAKKLARCFGPGKVVGSVCISMIDLVSLGQ